MVEIAAIVLAAGRGSRFGAAADESKAAAMLAGLPMVRRVVETALASRAAPVVVVTGHAELRVTRALAGLPLVVVHNAAYASGMAGSLQAGLAALPGKPLGVVVLLADMPLVQAATIDAMIERAGAEPGLDAIIPTHMGVAGNPVLIARSLFGDLMRLAGDTGARALFAEPGRNVLRLPVDDPGIVVDVDTPDALGRLAGRLR